jgi:hypothetical protein
MREPYFYTENNNTNFKAKTLNALPKDEVLSTPSYYSNTLTLDDFSTSAQLTNTDQAQFTVLANTLFNLDDSYDN